eukprot:1325445-Amorphochlora_amoeboformis.AAC.1
MYHIQNRPRKLPQLDFRASERPLRPQNEPSFYLPGEIEESEFNNGWRAREGREMTLDESMDEIAGVGKHWGKGEKWRGRKVKVKDR